MRVVLRNPRAADGRDFRYSLTVGREYEVLAISGGYFRLLTDDGEPVRFDAVCFDVTDPTEPAFWRDTGDEDDRHVGPPGWGVPGFYEAWFDGNRLIRRVFAEQLAAWYPNIAANLTKGGET